jgi:cytochrome c oxidase cbb3-type subunit 3
MRAALALLVALTACGRGAPTPADQRAGLAEVRHDEHVFAGGAIPQAARWENPYRRDQRAAAEGAKIFAAMNCDGCHGGGGAGWVGPSLADGRWRFGGSDGAIFESIYYGRPHGMPGYGGLLLGSEAIWRLVTYLQSLQPPADVPTESWR